jgi:branched-chain amino acid transport system ATP-binding protein
MRKRELARAASAAPALSSLMVSGCDAAYEAMRVTEDMSLSVALGETVVLLGTNGNGKSTLMKCVMGMLPASAGR